MEILKCPFCGGSAAMRENDSRRGFKFIFVKCLDCYSEGRKYKVFSDEPAASLDRKKKFAVDAWNKRYVENE